MKATEKKFYIPDPAAKGGRHSVCYENIWRIAAIYSEKAVVGISGPYGRMYE